MPKKSNTRRADGRIAVQVYIGRENGKRMYKTAYGKTQKEAEQKAIELKSKMKKGLDASGGRDTFSIWAEYWLNSKKTSVSQDQFDLLQSRTKFFIDRIANAKIALIKPVDLQPLIDELVTCNPNTGKPSAKKTLRSYRQILTSIFDYAIDNRIIDFNPAERLQIPKSAPQSRRRALTLEERKRVDEFEHRGKTAVMLLMYSGLRRGEATALRWSDIDLENGTITVSRSYNFKSKEFKPPKNGKPRKVFIPAKLVEYLKTVPQDTEYVITSAKGKMMSIDAWDRLLESYLFQMNYKYGGFTCNIHTNNGIPMVIEKFGLHDLRHTFCTIMYEAGIDVLVAQEQMGHADPKTTLDIYTHLQKEHKATNISKLNDYLSSQ